MAFISENCGLHKYYSSPSPWLWLQQSREGDHDAGWLRRLDEILLTSEAHHDFNVWALLIGNYLLKCCQNGAVICKATCTLHCTFFQIWWFHEHLSRLNFTLRLCHEHLVWLFHGLNIRLFFTYSNSWLGNLVPQEMPCSVWRFALLQSYKPYRQRGQGKRMIETVATWHPESQGFAGDVSCVWDKLISTAYNWGVVDAIWDSIPSQVMDMFIVWFKVWWVSQ